MENKKLFQKKILKICRLALFQAILLIVLPLLILTFYTVPGADDYSNTLAMFHADGGRWLVRAFKCTVEMYNNWQGAFTGAFSVYYGLGIYEKYGMTGLHIQNFITTLAYFVSYFFAYFGIWRMGINKRNVKTDIAGLLLFNIILFGFLHETYIADAFYWRSGSGMYTIPLILLYLSVWMYSVYVKNKKAGCLLLSSVLSFFAAGGSLGISVIVCTLYLGAVLWKKISSGKVGSILFVFISGLAGTLLNVIAPGNYIRHDTYETEYEIIKICWYTLKYSFSVIGEQFSSGILIVFFIISMISIKWILNGIKIKFDHPCLVILYAVISMIAVNFPVCFGYSSDSPNGRAEFVAKVSIYFFAAGMLWYLAGYIVCYLQLDLNRNIIVTLFICCLVAAKGWGYPNAWIEQKPLKVYFDLGYGKAKKFYETSLYILNELQNSDCEDVVVTVKEYDYFDVIRGIGLTPDKEYWANKDIAEYYKKNSAELRRDADAGE